MVDILRHLTGACGEPHFNIWHFIYGTPAFSYIYYLWKLKKNKKKKL